MEFQSKGIVETVSEDIRTKTNGGEFQKCTVKHLDGLFAGKTFFANRTIKNADDTKKAPIVKDQEVTLYNRIDGDQIYSEISTSAPVASVAELLALANSNANTAIQKALTEQTV